MKKLFNRTFFRFVLGFLAIVVVSFAIIIATDFYDRSAVSPEVASPTSGQSR